MLESIKNATVCLSETHFLGRIGWHWDNRMPLVMSPAPLLHFSSTNRNLLSCVLLHLMAFIETTIKQFRKNMNWYWSVADKSEQPHHAVLLIVCGFPTSQPSGLTPFTFPAVWEQQIETVEKRLYYWHYIIINEICWVWIQVSNQWQSGHHIVEGIKCCIILV